MPGIISRKSPRPPPFPRRSCPCSWVSSTVVSPFSSTRNQKGPRGPFSCAPPCSRNGLATPGGAPPYDYQRPSNKIAHRLALQPFHYLAVICCERERSPCVSAHPRGNGAAVPLSYLHWAVGTAGQRIFYPGDIDIFLSGYKFPFPSMERFE